MTLVKNKYGDRDSFLKTFNPTMQLTVAENVERAYTGVAPSLGLLKKTYGANMPVMWLMPQIWDLCEFTNSRGKLGESQIRFLAQMIAQEYGYLKVTELLMFFYRFKCGNYGRFYGTVDPLIIMDALGEFCKERSVELRKIEQEQEDVRKRLHDAEAISLQEYCRHLGLPPMSMIELLHFDKIKTFIESICDAIYFFAAILEKTNRNLKF